MADIASLGIKIDSTDVKNAKAELVGLEQQGQKAEQSVKGLTGSTDSLSQSVRNLAEAFAIYKLAEQVKDVALAAARYETLGVVMEQVGRTAGYTATQMESFAQGLQQTGISMTESRESLARLVQAHVDLANSQKLARIAQDAAVIGNMNSSEAFGNLVYGIQSANVHVLRTIGINVNFENSYKDLANQLGKTTTQLTDQEKTQARLNAVLSSGQTIVGTYEAAMGTAGKQINSMNRYTEDLKVVMGEVFQPALTLIIFQMADGLKEVTKVLKNNDTEITDWGTNFKLTIISIEAQIQRFAMLLYKVSGTLTGFMSIASFIPALITGNADSINTFAQMNEEFRKLYEAGGKQLTQLGALYEKTVSDNSPENRLNQAAIKASKERDDQQKIYMNSLKSFHDAEKTFTEYYAINDPILQQMRHVEEFTDKLKASVEYQTIFKAKGEAVADEWVNMSLAADKSLNKTALKDAAKDARDAAKDAAKDARDAAKDAQLYADTLAGAVDRYKQLTLSVYDYKVVQIWAEYEKEAKVLGQNNELLLANRDIQLQVAAAAEQRAIALKKANDALIYIPGNYEQNAYFSKSATGGNALSEATKRSEDLLRNTQDTDDALIALSRNTAKAMEKNFSDFYFNVMTGKLTTLKDFWNGILNSMARATADIMGQITKEMLFGAEKGKTGMAQQLGSKLGDWWESKSFSDSPTIIDAEAKGGIHSGSGLSAYSNSIVSAPTLFKFATGTGLMGEAGPEAVVPLTKMPSGDLGVKTSGSSTPPNITVNIHNNTGGEIKSTPKLDFNMKQMVLDIVLDGYSRDVGGFRQNMGGR